MIDFQVLDITFILYHPLRRTTNSDERLELVVAKEDWIGRHTDEERLGFIVPFHGSLSVGDAEGVSEGEIAIDNVLDYSSAIIEQTTELPDIPSIHDHSAWLSNFGSAEFRLVVELGLPHVVEGESNVSFEVFEDEVHDDLICISSNGTQSDSVKDDASSVGISFDECVVGLRWKGQNDTHWVLGIADTVLVELHVWQADSYGAGAVENERWGDFF